MVWLNRVKDLEYKILTLVKIWGLGRHRHSRSHTRHPLLLRVIKGVGHHHGIWATLNRCARNHELIKLILIRWVTWHRLLKNHGVFLYIRENLLVLRLLDILINHWLLLEVHQHLLLLILIENIVVIWVHDRLKILLLLLHTLTYVHRLHVNIALWHWRWMIHSGLLHCLTGDNLRSSVNLAVLGAISRIRLWVNSIMRLIVSLYGSLTGF